MFCPRTCFAAVAVFAVLAAGATSYADGDSSADRSLSDVLAANPKIAREASFRVLMDASLVFPDVPVAITPNLLEAGLGTGFSEALMTHAGAAAMVADLLLIRSTTIQTIQEYLVPLPVYYFRAVLSDVFRGMQPQVGLSDSQVIACAGVDDDESSPSARLVAIIYAYAQDRWEDSRGMADFNFVAYEQLSAARPQPLQTILAAL